MRLAKNLRLWRREIRPTVALALPIIGGLVSQILMGLIDSIMVGRLGVVPLAASAFVNATAHIPFVFGIGLLSAVGVATSQAYGGRRPHDAGETLRHGLVISVAAGLFAVGVLLVLHHYLDHLGQPPEVTDAARNYLLLFGASIFPALVAQGCKQFSDALKHPWAPTVVMLGGVLLNVLLNWVLIYGHWGAPALGLIGAGWATLIARTAIMLALFGYVLRAPSLKAWRPAHWRAPWSRTHFSGLLHLGWPVASQHLFEVSIFALSAVMMGWISATAIAAHQIAINCASLTFMSALGIGAAAGIRVGHAYGARQFARMRRIGFSAVCLSALIMAAFGVSFGVFGRQIAELFIASPDVVTLAARLLIVAAVFQMADGVQVTSISALRGLSDVRIPALIAVVSYWCVALPLASLLAFRFHLGAVGMWYGLATGLATAAVCLAWRFHYRTRSVRSGLPPEMGVAYPEHGDLP